MYVYGWMFFLAASTAARHFQTMKSADRDDKNQGGIQPSCDCAISTAQTCWLELLTQETVGNR